MSESTPELKTLEKIKPPMYIECGTLAYQSKGGNKVSQNETLRCKLVDDKGTWVVRAYVQDPSTGKMKWASKSTKKKVADGKKARREAERMKYDLARQLVEENTPQVLKGTTPFSVYLDTWLDDKDQSVRANTAKSYRDYAKVHITPTLGNTPVKDITWRDLQRFQDSLKRGHTNSTVKKIFIPVRGALDDAVRDGAITSNPASLVKRLPKEEKATKARALTSDEVADVLEAVERAGEPLRAAVTLALVCGLRRSEALGLRWIDIDLQKKTLKVRNTVTQNGDVLLDEEHTKTRGSRRTITLTDDMVSYLKTLRAKQLADGLTLDKVVAWPDGHTVRPDGISRMFNTMIKNSGIDKVRFHDLRHTAATMLANAGAAPKDLQAFLGHDDIEMTLGVYVHTDENAAANIAAMMGSVIEKALNRSENRSESNVIAM